jgi:hypothetical protein
MFARGTQRASINLRVGGGFEVASKDPERGFTAKAQGWPNFRRTLGNEAPDGRTLKEFHSVISLRQMVCRSRVSRGFSNFGNWSFHVPVFRWRGDPVRVELFQSSNSFSTVTQGSLPLAANPGLWQ